MASVRNQTFIKFYKYFSFAIFCLICLGGGVRAMNAGLSCPDWPLCFGQFIPEFHPQVYFEFIHRVLAGAITIAALYFNGRIIFAKDDVSRALKFVALGSLLLLIGQIVMGGLTVLLQLHDKVVAGHLAMGTGFFALSLWVYLSLAENNGASLNFTSPRLAQRLSVLLLIAVYGQILLGGLVASNYAALVCTEFPLCHGEFIPTLHGVLGLHIIHRLGAYTLATIITISVVYILKRVNDPELRKWAKVILTLVFVQIGIGISNVLFYTPPLITVLHLATGVCLLAVAVRIVHRSTLQHQN